ncbi:hypothetical protein [Geomicrobium sediminis]|uniref:Membrane protein n=1 Tax=Geomicrobium sediminis TaxID=1347788 RepID=A0ABS2PCJ2_9BACL|nr:hypothetical protein [Geomicrobium sediminis]MBM7633128.1 putative membrane protein [Geomicrobium sediminis]
MIIIKRLPEFLLLGVGLSLQLLIATVLIVNLSVATVSTQLPLPGVGTQAFAWFVFAVHLIGLILLIITTFHIKKSARKAGLRLLIIGAIMLIATLGATLIQSVLFIIAGVLFIVRLQERVPSTAAGST